MKSRVYLEAEAVTVIWACVFNCALGSPLGGAEIQPPLIPFNQTAPSSPVLRSGVLVRLRVKTTALECRSYLTEGGTGESREEKGLGSGPRLSDTEQAQI